MANISISAAAEIRSYVQAMCDEANLTKINGQPTNKNVDKLEAELAAVLSRVTTNEWGGKHGHLALVLNEAEYRAATGDITLNVDPLAKPGLTPSTLLNSDTAIVKARKYAQHDNKIRDYLTMEAVQDLMVQHIVTTIVDKIYVEELEQLYVKYKNRTIKDIITHLRDEWCVTTTLEKKEALAEFNRPWDHNMQHVTKYCTDLDKAQINCEKAEVKQDDTVKVQVFVESMIKSELFEEKELTEYEDKAKADKDWSGTKKYFIKLIKSKKRHTKTIQAYRGGYDSANSFGETSSVTSSGTSRPPSTINSTDLSTFDRKNLVAYTNSLEDAMESKSDEIAALTSSNTTLIEALQEQQVKHQQAMMAQQKEQHQAMMEMFKSCQTISPAADGGGGGRRRSKKCDPRYCNICKKPDQAHQDDDCWEKPGNEKRRPKWYVEKEKK